MDTRSRNPCFRAIQQSMESITQTVIYNEVRDKLFAKELLTLDDLDEYDKLTNVQAVRKMTWKVMHSITGCEKLLKALQEMQGEQYQDLAKSINKKCEENRTEDSSLTQHRNLVVTVTQQKTEHCMKEKCGNPAPQEENGIEDGNIKPQGNLVATVTQQEIESCTKEHFGNAASQNDHEFDTILLKGQEIADTLLRQDITTVTILKAIELKKNAGKSFTEFLMHVIIIFRDAINDNIICLKRSVGQSIIRQLNENFLILKNTRKNFCSTNHEEDPEFLTDSIAIVVLQSKKILYVIKSIQKTYWLKLSQSAKTIGTLLPIFKKITEMVNSIQEVDHEPIHQLFGNIEDLKASLDKIKSTLFLTTEIAGFSGSLMFAIGGTACIIVGGIMLATPAAPGGIPLVIVGGLVLGTSPVVMKAFKSFHLHTIECIDKAEKKGRQDSKKFVENHKNNPELFEYHTTDHIDNAGYQDSEELVKSFSELSTSYKDIL